ncbi:MAG: CoA transferase [Dehalococcoidia bacterium]
MTDDAAPAAPLTGVRVLDLGHYVAGPHCSRILLDQGASVLKIERPGGDPGRRLPPFLGDDPDSVSLQFLYLNHGKETLTLDLADPAGRARLLELARTADVVVENFRPGTLDRLGVGWEALHAANPRLILTSISNFGQEGPYRDYRAWDIVADAMGGLSYIYGYPDREPLTHGNAQASYRAGVIAASATIAALFNLDDEGEHVDISIMECVTAALRDTVPQYTFMGAVRRRGGGPVGGPGAITAAADGYVIPSTYGAGDWSHFARFMDAPELDDERFATGDGRQRHAKEVSAMARASRAGRRSTLHRAHDWGIGAGIVLTPEQALTCEQLAERGFFRGIRTDNGRTLPAPVVAL